MAETRLLSWDEITEMPMPSEGGAVLRRFFSGEQLTIARVVFEAGATVPEHAHYNEQIALVLSGAMEFTIEGEPRRVEAGQMVYLPANVRHGARALEPSLLIDVFAPPRADWEPVASPNG